MGIRKRGIVVVGAKDWLAGYQRLNESEILFILHVF